MDEGGIGQQLNKLTVNTIRVFASLVIYLSTLFFFCFFAFHESLLT